MFLRIVDCIMACAKYVTVTILHQHKAQNIARITEILISREIILHHDCMECTCSRPSRSTHIYAI